MTDQASKSLKPSSPGISAFYSLHIQCTSVPLKEGGIWKMSALSREWKFLLSFLPCSCRPSDRLSNKGASNNFPFVRCSWDMSEEGRKKGGGIKMLFLSMLVLLFSGTHTSLSLSLTRKWCTATREINCLWEGNRQTDIVIHSTQWLLGFYCRLFGAPSETRSHTSARATSGNGSINQASCTLTLETLIEAEMWPVI